MEGESCGLDQTHPLRYKQQKSPGLPPPQPHIRLRGARLRGQTRRTSWEIISHYEHFQVWTNSLGLISDSFHMFFDCTGDFLLYETQSAC